MCQMPNIWHIYHTKHQKHPFIRCVKCAKLLQHAIVPSQFCHGTDRSCIIYITILFSFSLSSSQISLSLRLLISVFFLISVFSVRLPQHADHQWPLNATDLTKDHHSTPPTICLLYSTSGSFFFFFPFFFFPFTFFGCGLMDGFRWADWWWVGSGCGLWQWVG